MLRPVLSPAAALSSALGVSNSRFLDPANLYLVAAAALLFGACVFAAKKAFPQMHAKIVACIAAVALGTVAAIWMLLTFATSHHEEAIKIPANQPPQTLQPDQE